MRERCEVCQNFRPETELAGNRNTVILTLDGHSVLLCVGHARIAENSGVTSFEGLRALYGAGRRSFVPRRGRASSAAGDEQRRSRGRRASDAMKTVGSSK